MGHKSDINELILDDVSNDKIISIIHKKYNIKHSRNDINTFRKKIEVDCNYQNKIIKIFEKLSIPLLIEDIEYYLNNDYGKRLARTALNNILFDILCQNKIVEYKRNEKTFSLLSNKNNEIIKKEENHKIKTIENEITTEKSLKSYNEILKHEIETLKKQFENFNPIENSIISKILDSSIATVYISSIPTNEENNYLEKLCSIYLVFLENLLIVLEYFKNTDTDITRYTLNNYILSKKINIADFDVLNILTNHIEFAIRRETIYYKVTDVRILNDFIEDVTSELSFYKQYLQSITLEENPNDKARIKEIDAYTEEIVNSQNSSVDIAIENEKNEDSETINDSKISKIDNLSINENVLNEELIKIKNNLQENIDRINLLLNEKQNTKDLDNKNEWIILSDDSIKKNIQINFAKKKITFKNINNLNSENLFKEFLLNISKQRNLNRNFEVDLFFENLEEFYTDNYDI